MLDYSSILAKCGTYFQCDDINITRANHLVKSTTSDLLRLKTAPGDYQKSLAGSLTEGDQSEVIYKGVQLTKDKRLHRGVSENAHDSEADCAPWKSDLTKIIDNTVKYMDEIPELLPLSSFSVFDTSLLPYDREKLATSGYDEIVELAKHFEKVLTKEEFDLIPQE